MKNMGACFSSSTARTSPIPTAKVIATDGSLREYSKPITVSEVLGIDRLSCVLCCSDSLGVDAHIPNLDLGASLELGQLYFVLGKADVKRPLSGGDMAALAVKASMALSVSSSVKRRWRRMKRKNSVLPFYGGDETFGEDGLDVIVRPTSRKNVETNGWHVRKLSTIEELNE